MSDQAKAIVQARPKTIEKASVKGSMLQRAAVNTDPINDVPPVVHEVLAAPGQPLDPETKEFMQSRFGHDFSSVRVHTDTKAAESAKSVNALAYTVGQDIAFGAGQYSLGTIRGKQLLAHELTHVVQQRFASTGPLQMAGDATNTSLEREADYIATRILSPASAATTKTFIGPISHAPAILSRKEGDDAPAGNVDQVKAEAKQDAHKVKFILQDNTYLGPYNQSDIMAIIERWANKPSTVTHTRLSTFDIFIVALGGQIFEVGWLVSQYTNAFDQLYRRMSDERVEQIKEWVKTRGQTFRDSQPNKEVEFEISKEDLVKGVKLAGNIAAAGVEAAADTVSGGLATLALVARWLIYDLPDLYNNIKSVIDFVETVRSLKFDDVKKLFSTTGIAQTLVKALFGQVPLLPSVEKEENREEDTGSDAEAKGLVKFFNTVRNIIKAVKRAYTKVVGFVNGILSTINITKHPWFNAFSMAYASVVHAIKIASNPGAVLGSAVAKIQELFGNFFSGLKTKVTETAGEIKKQVDIIDKPTQLIEKLASKAIEMVLNFVITHPPSPILALATKLAEALAGDTIIGMLRKKVPDIVDEMIKKIAESEVVKKITQPLQEPVKSLTDAIDNASTRVQGTVTTVESKATGLVGDGVQMVKELTGIDPLKPQPQNSTPNNEEKQPAAQPTSKGGAPSDFFGVLKHGIHSRLLALGEQELVKAGKSLGQAALAKGTQAVRETASKVKGQLLGPKVDFQVHGEAHQLWVEKRGTQDVILIASEPLTLEEKAAAYRSTLMSLKDLGQRKEAEKLISELQTLNGKVGAAEGNLSALEYIKHKIAILVAKLGDVLFSEEKQTFSELGKELRTRGRNIDRQVATNLHQMAPAGYRDFVNEIRDKAAIAARFDEQFLGYWNQKNMQSAGTRFHWLAKNVGRKIYQRRWPFPEVEMHFELEIARGKSRLDVLVVETAPHFRMFEFDYKTSIRSATGSMKEMEQHEEHLREDLGEDAAAEIMQEAVTWESAVRRELSRRSQNEIGTKPVVRTTQSQ